MQSTINNVMTRSTTPAGKPALPGGKNDVEKIDKVSIDKGTALSQRQGTLGDAVWENDPKLVTQLLEQIQTLTKSVSDLQVKAGINPAGTAESAGTQTTTASAAPPTFASRFPPIAPTAASSLSAAAPSALPPPTFANRFPPVVPSATSTTSTASATTTSSALPPPTFANRFQSVAPASSSATTAVPLTEDKSVAAVAGSDVAPLSGLAAADKAPESEVSVSTDLRSTDVEAGQAASASAADTLSRTHESNSLDNLGDPDEAGSDIAIVSALEAADTASVDEVMLLPDGYVALSKEYVDVFAVAFVTRWEHRMASQVSA